MPLREPSGRQQVAAVCYRIGSRGLEFLLVQTRNRRWIFPKGGVEPGLTQAQSAALEAFEEAGVHGRIEEMPFARYHIGKLTRNPAKNSRNLVSSAARGKAVTVHLCEVSHLETPQESNRKPTWFSPEKAKRRLLEDRAPEIGGELAGVVDRAVSRIRREQASNSNESQKDALQKVRFEAFENARLPDWGNAAALLRHLLLEHRSLRPSVPVEVEGQAAFHKLLQLGAGTAQKITPIDGGHEAKPSIIKAGRRRLART